MRALVIGADGFVGRWLVRHLVDADDDVVATVRQHSAAEIVPVSHRLDVRDARSVSEVVANAKPSAIYYLAGVTEPKARENGRNAVDVAIVGLLNVITASAELGTRPRLLTVGSAHMYIDTQTEPIREDAPIGGRSVYGATKAAAEMAAFAIGEQLGVDIVAARPFNHIGPGQSGAFVVPNFARQVASIAAGAVPAVIRAGSLAPERDFTDVRDVVRAYRMLVEGGEPQTAYNVASGRAVSIKQLLDQLVEIADIKVHVQTDPSLVRTDEPDRMVGDASRLNARTGWQPTIDLRKSLHDVYVEAKRAQSSSPGIDM